jgi:hypothetical protein
LHGSASQNYFRPVNLDYNSGSDSSSGAGQTASRFEVDAISSTLSMRNDPEGVLIGDDKPSQRRCSECGVVMIVAHEGAHFRMYSCPCCGVSVPEPPTVPLPPSVPLEK